MAAITDDDIRRVVSRNAFDAGLAYQADGRVRDVRAEGALIEAQVFGSEKKPYRQTIRLMSLRDGSLSISGTCTCPVGLNCKHVAAALFAYQEDQQPSLPLPVQATDGPAPVLPLPPDIDVWLRRLEAAQVEDLEAYPPTIRKRLLYVLDQDATGVSVGLDAVELGRDGKPTRPARRYSPHELAHRANPPKFLRPSDRAILRQAGYSIPETEEDFAPLLARIIATGRGRWARWDGPVLTEGAPVAGTIGWRMADNGSQRPELELPAPKLPLRLALPWYVDPVSGAVGPVETALPPRMVRALVSGPWLPPATAAQVRAELTRRMPNRPIPAPRAVAPPQTLRAKLQPRLQLLAGTLPFDPFLKDRAGRYAGFAPDADHAVPLARLSWQYGPIALANTATSDAVMHDGKLVHVARNRAAEARASERLRLLGFRPLGYHPRLSPTHPHARDHALNSDDADAWIEVMLHDLPDLRRGGWLVEVADDFPWRLATPTGDIMVDLHEGGLHEGAPHEGSGIDWFDLDLGVVVDGERVNLVPALLQLLATPGAIDLAGTETEDDEDAPLLLKLPDGRLLAVPMARLRPILAPLLELFAGAAFTEGGGALRLSRRQAADLATLEAAGLDAGLVWSGGEGLRALGRQLRDTGGIPACPVPPGFLAELRPYQQRGLDWLQFLRAAGLGGVLADDMGLGKTVQTLAHLMVEQAQGRLTAPALVVCPTSLVPNWRAEAARFAPGLRTLVLHGPDRAASFAEIGAHDLVVTTYPLLARDHDALAGQEWHVVVLDEAQTIKNPLAATSKLARTLRSRQRLCLSGTPLENHLGELWSLFDFLLPGFLGDRQAFGRTWRAPIEKGGDVVRQQRLARRVAPFLLRRTKAEVAADLPPKTEIAEEVELGTAQRAIYEGIRLAMHSRVRQAIAERGLAGSGIIILDALLKLRQACCDPRLLKLTTARAAQAGSAKLDRLMELVPELVEEGRRVLVFSQFTSMLALIEAALAERALPYALLTGDTRDRTGPVRRFQAGEVPIFLISLKAGGVGLNLTAADTVIHYDPWWNPAVEAQATDRAHRIGQDKPVFVHRLITRNTIEEKMETLKARKQALVAGILGAGEGATLRMTEEDVATLFEPMGGGAR